MTRSPLVLAALASSAVPGLDPVSVEGVRVRPGDRYETAHVQDSQDRRWVVSAPRTQADGAMVEDVTALLALLVRRLDVAVPVARGHAVVPEGRAAVSLRIPGRQLDFAGLPPGDLAAEVGRVLAHIHNIEHLLFEEAGRPVYDAESHRRRQLSELDRAAATGHVPTQLLTRWERSLEDVSLWRFAPTAVHGAFSGRHVLASFDDEDDASQGHIRGVLAWEEARIGDPADDFAELSALASREAFADVLEAYTQSRVERPDPHLERRARLAAEMSPVRVLLRSLAAGEPGLVEEAAEQLRHLDERTWAEDEAAERARRDDPVLADEEAHAPGVVERGPADQTATAGPEMEVGEPDWDATQPHPVVLTHEGATQAMPRGTLREHLVVERPDHGTDHEVLRGSYAGQMGGRRTDHVPTDSSSAAEPVQGLTREADAGGTDTDETHRQGLTHETDHGDAGSHSTDHLRATGHETLLSDGHETEQGAEQGGEHGTGRGAESAQGVGHQADHVHSDGSAVEPAASTGAAVRPSSDPHSVPEDDGPGIASHPDRGNEVRTAAARAQSHLADGRDDLANGLTEEDDGLLDLHEGASEFVPVDRHRSPRPTPTDDRADDAD